jgi:hypothetical protein
MCIKLDYSPAFPAVGDGECCEGAVLDGPGSCTCWEPVYSAHQQPVDEEAAGLLAAGVQPVTRQGMCGDCAYRPDSFEKTGDPRFNGDADMLEGLAASGERFWCHDGLRRIVAWRHPAGTQIPAEPGCYRPTQRAGVPYQADGQPGLLCAGWAARNRALDAARRRATDAPPL